MTGPIFFKAARRISAAEIASHTGASLTDPAKAGVTISNVAALARAGVGDLSFAEGKRYAALARSTRAAILLCTADLTAEAPTGAAVLVTPRPQLAFSKIGRLLHPEAEFPRPLTATDGVSLHAHVDPSATIEPGATIEAGAVIGPEVAVGAGTTVAPHAVVGRGCQIGRNCFVGPHASLQFALLGDRVIVHAGARIGQDGFGYVGGRNGPEKMPQIGRVVIQNGVEIGANTTVDRGALDDTVIGENTKIDNLVQIAHNVRIGRNCLIAAHCGISGSVNIGDGVMLGGRVGLTDHVSVGDGAQLAAASGVMHDVPAGARWGGAPAQPMRGWLRGVAALKRLSDESGRKSGDG